jgi:hypothetical protein
MSHGVGFNGSHFSPMRLTKMAPPARAKICFAYNPYNEATLGKTAKFVFCFIPTNRKRNPQKVNSYLQPRPTCYMMVLPPNGKGEKHGIWN